MKQKIIHPNVTAVSNAYPDANIPYPTGYAAAILGVDTSDCENPRMIMSVSKILAIIISENDGAGDEDTDPYTQAREHFDFNIGGGYIGRQTPIWCEDEIMFQ